MKNINKVSSALFRQITILVLFLAGVVFAFFVRGYSFLGQMFFLAAFIILAYYLIKLLEFSKPKPAKILNRILSYGLVFFLMVFGLTAGAIIYESSDSTETTAEYAIVLGAGVNGTEPSHTLLTRLEAALEYLETHPDTKCVLSGGQGPNEEITEAECMYNWLVDKGIDPSRLFKEERSSRTAENVAFSYEIICADAGREVTEIAIITNNFHTMRARMIASDNGIEAISISAPLRLPVLTVNYYMREVFAVWKYFIFG